MYYTKAEIERLQQEWQKCMMFTTSPLSFEAWLAERVSKMIREDPKK